MCMSMALLLFLVASDNAFSLSKGQDVSSISNASAELGEYVHRNLGTGNDGNVLISPIGISTALVMLHYGIQDKAFLDYKRTGLSDSKVHTAFKQLFETISRDSDVKEYLLRLANAVFTQKGYPIPTEYKDVLLQNYNATERDVDFQNEDVKAVKDINDWVKLTTNNEIEKMLDGVDPSTVMMYLNAVFFKGTWKTGFNPKKTSEEVFYNNGLWTEKTNVEMMHLVEELPYLQFGKGSLIELPYEGGDIVLILYLSDSMDGAYEAEKKLTADGAIQALKLAKTAKIHMSIPKFKLEYETSLKTVLKELGSEIFEKCADLIGINEADLIAASKVMQKTCIEFNTEGSLISGIIGVETANIMGDEGRKILHKRSTETNEEGRELSRDTRMANETRTKENIKRIHFNHPFLCALHHKKLGFLVFQGRVGQL